MTVRPGEINIEFNLGHTFKGYDATFNYSIIKCHRCNLLLMINQKFDKSKYRVAVINSSGHWFYYPNKKILSCDEVIIQNIIE
jgi:hypothetical protein